MSERIHALAQLLPGKSSLDECSVEELQHLADRYPYFAPAQFLLLQKLKAIGSPDAEIQQRKAVLYYHDPLQFDYFVSSEKFYIDEAVLTESVNMSEAGNFPDMDEKHPTEFVGAGEQAFLQQDHAGTESMSFPADLPPDSDASEKSGDELSARVHPPSETDEHDVHHQEHLVTDEWPATREERFAEELLIETPSDTEEDRPVSEDNEYPAVEQPAVPLGSPISSEEGNNRTREEEAVDTATAHSTVSETGLQAQPAEKPAGEVLAFEPFHTVDYFASQGIKFSVEELPKDRLGKQMRSFTDWLKMMKRLPASDMARTPESPAEKTVENLASHSVEESDVVTEAMAEVWAKQGNRAKAMETYNKLSLLNPSKKAYFAAKIENLKGS